MLVQPSSKVSMHVALPFLKPHFFLWPFVVACAERPAQLACPTCVVEFAQVVTLGHRAGGNSPTMNSYVARDHHGRFYVTRTFAGGGTAVFGPGGSFLTEIGRQGSGPGEFRMNWRAVPRGDTVFIIDRGNLRVMVVDSSGREARSFNLTVSALDMAHTANGSIVLYANTADFSEDMRTGPLVLVDGEGSWIKSFGDHRDFGNDIRIASDRANGVWITKFDEYEISNYSADGRLIRNIEQEREWFKPHSLSIVRRALRGVVTTLMDIQTDSAGRLWTLVQEWEYPHRLFRGAGAENEGDQRKPLTPAELIGTVRYHIEVFDHASTTALASAYLDTHVLRGFVEADGAGPFVFGLRETDDGELQIDVLALRLTRKEALHKAP